MLYGYPVVVVYIVDDFDIAVTSGLEGCVNGFNGATCWNDKTGHKYLVVDERAVNRLLLRHV